MSPWNAAILYSPTHGDIDLLHQVLLGLGSPARLWVAGNRIGVAHQRQAPPLGTTGMGGLRSAIGVIYNLKDINFDHFTKFI